MNLVASNSQIYSHSHDLPGHIAMLGKIKIRPTTRSCLEYRAASSLFLPTTPRGKQADTEQNIVTNDAAPATEEPEKAKAPKKTLAQLDEELKAAMEGRAGDGGLAGAELEGGKAVSMKRGVRDNMFRYI